MQVMELYKLLEKNGAQEEASRIIHSIRSDELIYAYFENSSSEESEKIASLCLKNRFDPGTLGLLALNQKLVDDSYPQSRLPTGLLEEYIVFYESFLQQGLPPESLENATKLAVVLLEKKRITPDWRTLWLEIVKRMKIVDGSTLKELWGTVLVLVLNLSEEKKDVLTALWDLEPTLQTRAFLIHGTLGLPIDENFLAAWLVETAGGRSFGLFEKILFDLIASNERSLAITAAQLFIEKNLSDPSVMIKTDLSTEHMEGIFDEVLKLKQSSSIAQIAQDYSLAVTYFDASEALMDTVTKGFDLQKRSLQGKTANNSNQIHLVDETVSSQGTQDSNDENFDSVKQTHHIDHFTDEMELLTSLDQVKKIFQKGQKELARAELQKLFSDQSDETIKRLAGFRSKFDPEWNPVEIIYDFLDMEEVELAEKLAAETIRNNPASESANLAAAMALVASGKYAKAQPILEVLSFSESKDINLLRVLADCYEKTGDVLASLKIRRVIVDHCESSADLLDFAETAIQCGMPEEARTAAQKVLEHDPLDAVAQTKIARSLALQGRTEEAEEYFQKALDTGMTHPQVWIAHAEYLFEQRDYQRSIDSLRQGLIVLPDDFSIRKKLAELLMESGSAAEALPYLNELVSETSDVGLQILRIEAMKILGLTEYKDLIEELHEKFPENLEVTQEHAAELIKEGRHLEAKKIIQEKFDQIDPEDETALTYVDALIGLDVRNSSEAKVVSTAESIKAQEILNASLEKNPDQTRANLLQGEFYLQKSRYNEAYEIYSGLMAKQAGVDKTLLERIQAGFAVAAANLGKFEEALAAIKQAVDSKPDWVGLRKIFAQIYALAGEISEAVKEAQTVIQAGSQLIEGIFWFTGFLSSLGKDEEAVKAIEKAITENPDDINLRCRMAELLIRNNKMEQARSAMEGVKVGLSNIEDTEMLLSIAKTFSALTDEDATLIGLKKIANTTNEIGSKLDLAGYLCLIGRHQEALQELRNIEDANWVRLFEIDVMRRSGEFEIPEIDLEEEYILPENLSLHSEFTPPSWQKLLQSPNPLLGMQARISFASGNPEKTFELAKKWYGQDGEEMEARLLMLESSLAMGEKPDDEIFSGLMQGSEKDPIHAHLLALWVDDLVEKGQAIEAQQLIEKFGDLPSLGMKLARIRIASLSGHITDAEELFDEGLAELDTIQRNEALLFFGLVRMAVNAGISLKRWNEILSLSQQLANTYPWNVQVIDQALSVLVQAKEFEELSASLSITSHSPKQYFAQHDSAELFECLSALAIGYAENTVKRWLLRGKMAMQPVDENIRAFALVTNTAEDSAAMAAALVANGQKETALQVAKKFSDHPAMLLEMAKIHAQQDEIHLSLECLNSLIAADPLNPVAFAFRSLLFEGMENLDHAINDLEQAVSDWPDEVKWRTKAASLWRKYGNQKNALIQLESAYEIDPRDVEVVLELAQVCLDEKQPDRTIEYVKILTEENPNIYEAWEVLSEAYAMQGDMANALAAAQRAGKINTFSLKPYLMAGRIYLDSGDLDKAYTQAKAAINQNKKDAEVVLFLARVLHAKGEERQALATLETMHRCDNVTAQTMIDHVNLVREINGSASAKELIASLSGKFPENIELMKLLANAQVENGDTIEAEETAKKALQVDPDEPDIHMFLGKLNADSGQLDQAISHLSQGITHRAANLDGYLLLSRVYEQQREYAKAIDTLKKAMEVSPLDTRSFIAAANLYRNSKNYSAAEQILQKAVEIDPQDVSLRRQLGALLALKLVHHSQEASMNS